MAYRTLSSNTAAQGRLHSISYLLARQLGKQRAPHPAKLPASQPAPAALLLGVAPLDGAVVERAAHRGLVVAAVHADGVAG